MSIELQAKPRTRFTTSYTKHLRQTGKLPAVLYGKQIEALPITVEEKPFLSILKTHPGSTIGVDVEGVGKQQAIINEIQKDPFTQKIIHVAFHLVESEDAVRVHVHLQLTGEPAQREIKFQVQASEIEIKCVARYIPNEIEVDLSKLSYAKPITVKDLIVSDKIQILAPASQVIVSAIH